jgi:Ca-activated chloride channel family protein
MIRVLTADELKDLAGDRTDAGFGSIETTQGCLPLTALDVDVQIEGLAAETTVRQQFRNVFDEPLEATYIFPLPPRAAVTGFRMTVNDTVVEAASTNAARPVRTTTRRSPRAARLVSPSRSGPTCLRCGSATSRPSRLPASS